MGDTFSLKITDKVSYIQHLDRSRYDSTDLFRIINRVKKTSLMLVFKYLKLANAIQNLLQSRLQVDQLTRCKPLVQRRLNENHISVCVYNRQDDLYSVAPIH